MLQQLTDFTLPACLPALLTPLDCCFISVRLWHHEGGAGELE